MANLEAGTTRVVVVDDHPFFRDGVSRALARDGRIRVVGEAGGGRDALELIAKEKPDVALIDYQLPDIDGLTVVHALVRDHSSTRAVLLTATTDSAIVFKALQVGAAGFLPKDAPRPEIISAVLSVAAGRDVIAADLTGGLASEIRMRASSDAPVLTEREQQVLRAFAEGLSVPQTADRLILGASTVKTYAQRLYEKLGVSDRAAAVAVAMRRGLLE